MMLLCVGANFQSAPVDLRERLAFDGDRLTRGLLEIASRYGCETVILSTCNRVELYVARLAGEVLPDAALLTEFLAEFHGLPVEQLQPAIYGHRAGEAVRHLFRVASSLDSLVLGEGQIARQVKQAYESAQQTGTVGPLLHALFQHARLAGKRIRTETGIAEGKVSIPSLAMDYVVQVFAHFGDKTVLVIGAGKMGELTLKHLAGLKPKWILVANRSPEKAAQVAAGCGGQTVAWEQLDTALAKADIILSTTGAAEPVVTRERFARTIPHRHGKHVVILDIAVPRDFEPSIGEFDEVDLLVNIDDLKAIRERILQGRTKHLPATEAIVEAETARFMKEWTRRRAGPAIARLSQDWDAIRKQVEAECLSKLNGKLSEADKQVIAGALRLLQNRLMHAPISALRSETEQESEK